MATDELLEEIRELIAERNRNGQDKQQDAHSEAVSNLSLGNLVTDFIHLHIRDQPPMSPPLLERHESGRK